MQSNLFAIALSGGTRVVLLPIYPSIGIIRRPSDICMLVAAFQATYLLALAYSWGIRMQG